MTGASPRKEAGRETGLADALVMTAALDRCHLREAVDRAEALYWENTRDRMAWWAYSDTLRFNALREYRRFDRPLPWEARQ